MTFRKPYVLFLRLFALVSLLSSAGCAFGPLMVHETARTVGDRRDELSLGYGSTGADFKWHHGFHDNLDIGFQVEYLGAGLRAKWAFLNNQKAGPSAAMAVGYGYNWGGDHVYGDLIASYLEGQWEPYTSLRGVNASVNSQTWTDEKTGQVEWKIPRHSYQYGQFTLGTRYWFNQKFMMNIEASKLFSEEIEINDSSVLFSVNLGLQY